MLRRPLPPKRDRTGEFDSFVPSRLDPASVRMASLHRVIAAMPTPVPPKIAKLTRKRQSLRGSASGEECTLRLTNVCNCRTDTTVLAHWPGLDGDRGMGMKSLDHTGAFACFACHEVVDMRVRPPWFLQRDAIELAFFRGHLRTLVRWAQRGLL